MGNILLVITIVISLLTAGVGFMNRTKLVDTQGTLASTEQSLAQTKDKLAGTESQLKESQDEVASLTGAKESLETQLTASKSEAESAKAEVATLTTQVSEKQADVDRLTAEVSTKDTRIAELEQAQTGAVAGGTDPSEELRAELAEKDTLIEKLQSDLAANTGQLDTLRTREADRAAKRMRAGLQGKIVAINPAWNFVVLNVGDRNGVINNAEMLVKRGGNLIGKVRITSVEPSTAIADIVASSVPRGYSIQAGDSVIYMVEE